MKLHYALAALAVAAMSFSASAADPVNLMAGWAGSGQGAKETPADFGWIATPDITWSETFTGPSYLNGYRDDLGLNGTNIRGLLITQTNSVIAYPVKNMTKGVYKFSVNAAYMNHGGIVQTFDFNSKADGTGVSYGKTTITNAAKWGAYDSANFEFALTEDVETVYMCWTVSDTKDRRVTWGYSLVEYTTEEYSSMYASKKAEAEALLNDEEYKNVTGSEKTTLEAVASDAAVEPSDYKQAVIDLVVAMNTFKAAKTSYDGWAAMRDKATTEAVKALYDGADAQYMGPLNAALEDPENAEAAATATAAIESLVREAIMGKVLGAGEAIEVPGATMPSDGVIPSVWNTVGDGKLRSLNGERPDVWNMFMNYYDTNRYDDATWTCKLSQSIDLAPGKYTLALVARSSTNDHTFALFAGDKKVELPHAGNSGNALGRGWNVTGLSFEVAASEANTPEGMIREGSAKVPVEIGVNIDVNTKSNWFSFNDFRLVRNGDVISGIEVVEAEENAPAVYYNLNGVRVDGNDLTPGVYVVRRGAKAEKILVK